MKQYIANVNSLSSCFNRRSLFRLLSLLLFLSILVHCTKKPQRRIESAVPNAPVPVVIPPADFHRGMWVRAVSIASTDSLARIIEIAKEMHITDIYVQAVVAGYAYYNSAILPRSQYLAEISPPSYDPLDSLIVIAFQESIRVHAWVNALLVWSLTQPPDSLRHLYYQHPDWFIKDATGLSMRWYSCRHWQENGLEGLYLDPAHPEVQRHIALICQEIVTAYPVHGIHLDFIRYPGTLWGLSESDSSFICAGLDGYTVRWMHLCRYPQLSFTQRWVAWHNWKQNINKEQKIIEIQYKISEKIKGNALNPDCILTSAVFADPSMARYRFAQNWPFWSAIEYPVIMSYYETLEPFYQAMAYALDKVPQAVFGIGLLWEHIDTIAYMQSQSVRAQQTKGLCYFDFTNLDTLTDRSVLMGTSMTFHLSSDIQEPSLERIHGVFADPAPTVSSLLIDTASADQFIEYLLSLSFNPSDDLARLSLSPAQFKAHVYNDITAFNYLDSHIFPLSDTLIEPSTRYVRYEFYPWNGQDTIKVISAAKKTVAYTCDTLVYPSAVDPIARAVFNMEKGQKKVIKTMAGVYAIYVIGSKNGGDPIAKEDIDTKIFPMYASWTLLQRAEKILNP